MSMGEVGAIDAPRLTTDEIQESPASTSLPTIGWTGPLTRAWRVYHMA
jgi:hypothetical protein